MQVVVAALQCQDTGVELQIQKLCQLYGIIRKHTLMIIVWIKMQNKIGRLRGRIAFTKKYLQQFIWQARHLYKTK